MDQPHVIYNKTENLVRAEDFEGFDWVISESMSMPGWVLEKRIDGLEGVRLKGGLKVQRQGKLWILKRMY